MACLDMDNEIWKPIRGYENRYSVSNFGRVKNHVDGNLLALQKRVGYIRACLVVKQKQKRFSVHRLVAEAFIPNNESKPFINHKDFNRANNVVENLEWVTTKENAKHRKDSGRYPKLYGGAAYRSKFTNQQAKEIRERYAIIKNQSELAREYRVSQYCIWSLVHNLRYTNVP